MDMFGHRIQSVLTVMDDAPPKHYHCKTCDVEICLQCLEQAHLDGTHSITKRLKNED